jgi:hypothetical protein
VKESVILRDFEFPVIDSNDGEYWNIGIARKRGNVKKAHKSTHRRGHTTPHKIHTKSKNHTQLFIVRNCWLLPSASPHENIRFLTSILYGCLESWNVGQQLSCCGSDESIGTKIALISCHTRKIVMTSSVNVKKRNRYILFYEISFKLLVGDRLSITNKFNITNS